MMWRIGLSRTRTIDPVFGAVIDHGTFSSSAVQFAPVGRQVEIIIPGAGGLVQPWQRAAYEAIERQYGQLERTLVDAAANQVAAELEEKGDALTKSGAGEQWRSEYHLDCITLPRTEGDSTQWEAMFACATTGDDYAVRVRRGVVYEVENLGH
jgi:hypothetical protein